MSNIGSSIAKTSSDITVTTPTIANVTITNADTEYNYSLPAGTRRFKIQNRTSGLIKLSFTVSESGTNYWSLWPGQKEEEETINQNSTLVLYFQSPKSSQLLEIVSWV